MKNKGCYLMGKCENNETANSRYRVLVNRFGLREDIIKFHPSNYDDLNEEQQRQVESEFGGKILGAFVGHANYIKRQLKLYLEQLTLTASSLISYPDLQGRLLLFMAKPLHLFRTTRSDLLVDFTTDSCNSTLVFLDASLVSLTPFNSKAMRIIIRLTRSKIPKL
jgi:hypothetical protein